MSNLDHERTAEPQVPTEQLQSEVAALRERAHTFEALAENAAYGLLIALSPDRHVFVNRRAAEMTGYAVDELLELGMRGLIHPDELPTVLGRYTRRMAGEPVPERYETVVVAKDGRSIPIEISPTRTMWQGQVANMVVIRDISEEQRAHEEHDRAEERQHRISTGLHAVLAIADELIACPDTDHLLRRAVELARERLDVDRCSIFVIDGDLMRGTYGTSLQGETTDEHEWHFAAGMYWSQLRQGPGAPRWGPLEQPYREWTGTDMGTLDAEGATAYALIESATQPIGVLFNDNAISGRPLDPTTQEIVAVYCSLLGNIIHRQRTEEALRQSERRFREMADLLPDLVYETDASLRLTYGNQAAFRVLGYSPEAVASGLSIADLLAPGQAATAEARLREIAETGSPGARVYDLRRADGSTLACEIHSMAMRDTDGRLMGFRGVVRDISERQRMEHAQRLSAVGELAAGVAHEFNNLLAGLMMQADVADRTESLTAYRLLAHIVRENAARGGDICNDLLEFARPREPKREPVSLEASLEAALAVAAHHIEHAEVEVTRRFRSEGRLVDGDASRLQQVFLNLIINSCDAMSGGGELVLETCGATDGEGRPEIVATVADTGRGIDPETLPHIFEPFFTTKVGRGGSDGRGAGLGLSVSRSIVAAHGGTIEVRSQPGAGTTIELQFPAHGAVTEEPAGRAITAAPTGPLSGPMRRVLVVDDEWVLRDVVQLALESEGCQVVATASSAEAIAALRAGTFDLVICDWLMPCGGGREVIETVRELPNPPPVVVITGWSEDGFDDTLSSLGVAKCLSKPFGVEQLLAGVWDLLGKE